MLFKRLVDLRCFGKHHGTSPLASLSMAEVRRRELGGRAPFADCTVLIKRLLDLTTPGGKRPEVLVTQHHGTSL
jgi:hypothetical protein